MAETRKEFLEKFWKNKVEGKRTEITEGNEEIFPVKVIIVRIDVLLNRTKRNRITLKRL